MSLAVPSSPSNPWHSLAALVFEARWDLRPASDKTGSSSESTSALVGTTLGFGGAAFGGAASDGAAFGAAAFGGTTCGRTAFGGATFGSAASGGAACGVASGGGSP